MERWRANRSATNGKNLVMLACWANWSKEECRNRSIVSVPKTSLNSRASRVAAVRSASDSSRLSVFQVGLPIAFLQRLGVQDRWESSAVPATEAANRSTRRAISV